MAPNSGSLHETRVVALNETVRVTRSTRCFSKVCPGSNDDAYGRMSHVKRSRSLCGITKEAVVVPSWTRLCFTVLQIVSEAAGQGVTITGDKHRNTWDWVNSVIFAATIVTTIGLYELQDT